MKSEPDMERKGTLASPDMACVKILFFQHSIQFHSERETCIFACNVPHRFRAEVPEMERVSVRK